MNQILFTDSNNIIETHEYNENNKHKKIGMFLKFQFIACSIITIICSSYFIYYQYLKQLDENFSKKLVNEFNIVNLYSSQNVAQKLESRVYKKGDQLFSIIGLIRINKINIEYPIISEFSKELLKIGPCKFYGPQPNTVGNLCIAGHNYNNQNGFSRLKDLQLDDSIFILDLYGNNIEYSIYKTYETSYQDLSCLEQNTHGKREITLITCNNIKNERRIIKARQKG